jgi:hypothetical protein
MPAACSMPWSSPWKPRTPMRQGASPSIWRSPRSRSSSGPCCTTSRGCPFRHHQCLHQVAAGFRPRCRALLARPHAGGWGGSPLSLPSDAHLGGRRCGLGRSHGRGGGGGLRGQFRTGGPAGRPLSPGPGGPLSGQHGEKQQHFWGCSMPSRWCDRPRSNRCPPTCGMPIAMARPSATGRATAIPTPTRSTGWPSNICPQRSRAKCFGSRGPSGGRGGAGGCCASAGPPSSPPWPSSRGSWGNGSAPAPRIPCCNGG